MDVADSLSATYADDDTSAYSDKVRERRFDPSRVEITFAT